MVFIDNVAKFFVTRFTIFPRFVSSKSTPSKVTFVERMFLKIIARFFD